MCHLNKPDFLSIQRPYNLCVRICVLYIFSVVTCEYAKLGGICLRFPAPIWFIPDLIMADSAVKVIYEGFYIIFPCFFLFIIENQRTADCTENGSRFFIVQNISVAKAYPRFYPSFNKAIYNFVNPLKIINSIDFFISFDFFSFICPIFFSFRIIILSPYKSSVPFCFHISIASCQYHQKVRNEAVLQQH